MVHAGIYYEPGSLKARLCVEGARASTSTATESGIPFERNGKLIVAADEGELARLDELERRGRANGVAGLRRLAADEIARGRAARTRGRGPALPGHRRRRLRLGRRGAFAADVAAAGGAVHVGCRVVGARGRRRPDQDRPFAAGRRRRAAAIFCAGLWSDRLAVDAGAPAGPAHRPVPRLLPAAAPGGAELVRGSIYPVPDPELPFLGAHLTRGLDGAVPIGPSALIASRSRRLPSRAGAGAGPARDALLARDLAPGAPPLAGRPGGAAARASRRAFAEDAARLVPALRPRDTRRGPAGVRAQALGRDGRLVDDFVVHRTERAIHVRNAPSPAATSSLALAGLIADELDAIE